jgi:predicted  nucleic acid-binding Zn-ribbon protein
MSTTDKPKPKPTPIYCTECGAHFSDNPALKGCLCPTCGRRVPSAEYWSRRRDREGLDPMGPNLDGAHAAFTAATMRHFSR